MDYTFIINGQPFAVSVAQVAPAPQAAQSAPAPAPAPVPSAPISPVPAAPPPAAAPGPDCLVPAGRAGAVARIHVTIGQAVAAGAPLALIAGHTATAPQAGLVKQILVNRNTLVRADDILLVLK